MNKERRVAIDKVKEQLETLSSDVEMLRDEEQEYFDNMPESLQGGEKGDNAESAVSSLDSAVDSLSGACNSLEEAVEN